MRLTVIALAAFALQSPPAAADLARADAVTQYRTQMHGVLQNCSFLLIREIEEANAGYVPDPKQKDDVPNCLRDGRRDVKVAYDAAAQSQRKPAARDALKGVQVAFLAAMDGLMPDPEERRTAYFSRQGHLKARITEAWARFEVER
jgi:hypothetical protein